jgi:hypothetical protein
MISGPGATLEQWAATIPFCQIDYRRAEFVATMIDTEGCIVIRRGPNGGGTITYRAVIAIANTSAALIEKTQSAIGFGQVYTARGRNRRVFNYVVTGPRAANVLSAVYPFLIVKKTQAAIAIYLQGLNKTFGGAHGRVRRNATLTAALERCHAAVSALNRGMALDLEWLPDITTEGRALETAPTVQSMPALVSPLKKKVARRPLLG